MSKRNYGKPKAAARRHLCLKKVFVYEVKQNCFSGQKKSGYSKAGKHPKFASQFCHTFSRQGN
jgi:hypothetical protein